MRFTPIIDGNATDRVFDILDGAPVTITDVTIRNGSSVGAFGGGIRNAGTLTLTQSILSANQAYGGGGLHNSSRAFLTNVNVAGNAATNGSGGGISSSYVLIVAHGNITANTAGWNGGGVSLGDGSDSNLSDITSANNTATQDGGGIYLGPGRLYLADINMRDNKAKDGGGVSLGVGAMLTVNGATFSGNSAKLDGGALYGYFATNSNLTNVTVNANTALNGGGIHSWGALGLTRVTVRNNTATWSAGGIVAGQSLVLNDSQVIGNSAPNIGGIDNFGTGVINNTTIASNSADEVAGGIINSAHKNLIISNSTISNNTVRTKDGGGFTNAGTATLTSVTVSGNTASQGHGGGIQNSGVLTITNGTIYGNTAPALKGGGINNASATVALLNTIVAYNNGGNCYGTIKSNGYNLDSANTCRFANKGDKTQVNPLLAPLDDNGGPTLTRALLAGSPAINAGTNVGCPLTDQRGVARPQGALCDIGAFEVDTVIVGPGTYENNNTAIRYSGTWTRITSSSASGGSFERSSETNASAALNVAGATRFSITTALIPDGGIANVLVDNMVIGSFDTFGSTRYRVVKGPYALPDTGHYRVSLQVSGTKNAASSGYTIVLDNFVVSYIAPTLTPTPAPTATPTLPPPVTWNVNSTLDERDANPGDGNCTSTPSGLCTLRAAIDEANALAGADTINLPAGIYTLSLSGNGEDNNASGDLDLKGDVTLVGAGADTTIIDGNNAVTGDRVLDIPPGARVTISGVTIRNGKGAGDGGGLLNHGNATLDHVALAANTAPYGRGGGIYNSGTLAVSASSFETNAANYGGGAISNEGIAYLQDLTFSGNYANTGAGIDNSGSVNLGNSAITGNTARTGGGIYNTRAMIIADSTISGNINMGIVNLGSRAAMTITNSTISTNTSTGGEGGGFWNDQRANLTISNSTVSGNRADLYGGGIYNYAGNVTLTFSTLNENSAGNSGDNIFYVTAPDPSTNGYVRIKSTIIASRPSGKNCAGNLHIFSQGYNIDSEDSCNLTASSDMRNTAPLLGPLADNGGSTFTHALLPGSPAINTGSGLGCPDTDQRGVPRPQGANCDRGAFETAAVAPCAVVPARPAQLTPRNGATLLTRQVLLDWTNPGCSTRYELIVRLGSATGAIVDNQTFLAISRYTTGALTPGKSYYWRVRACDAKGCSAWTGFWKFTPSP